MRLMGKLTLIIIFIFLIDIALAIPNMINIQGSNLYNSSTFITEATIPFQTNIYANSASATSLFAANNNVDILNGTFSFNVDNIPLEIFINHSEAYFGIGIDGNAETKLPFVTVPYAAVSNYAENISPSTRNDLIDIGNISWAIENVNNSISSYYNHSIILEDFNKSISLDDYNYSVMLDNYISDASLYQLETNAFKTINLTNFFGDTNINSTINRSISLINYNYSISLDGYNSSISYITVTESQITDLSPHTIFTSANISDYLGGSDRNASLISVGNLSNILVDTWIANDLTIETTKDITLGGGYGSGGITLTTDGNLYLQSLFISGNITPVDTGSVNGSLLPYDDNIFSLGSGDYRWLSANISGTIEADSITVDEIRVNKVRLNETYFNSTSTYPRIIVNESDCVRIESSPTSYIATCPP